MKVVNIRDAKARLSAVVEESQNDRVLLTRHGKPAALVIGVEGRDLEEIVTRSDPLFWAMIEERRRSTAPRVPLEELERRYADASPRSRPRKKRTTKQ